LLLRANRTAVERLDVGGPMLGAIENSAFDSGYLAMNPGDMLVAYSDGVTECRNPADQEFEIDRLSAAALAAHGRSANPALFSMLGSVLDFADSNTPGDDLTLLVVRRRLAFAEGSGRQEKDSEPLPKAATAGRLKKNSPRGRGSK
jgi:sigma-B regulation protein RsbU (phosphoserine phosphatase)